MQNSMVRRNAECGTRSGSRRSLWRPGVVTLGVLLAVLVAAVPARGARQAKVQGESGEGDFEASRLLDKAAELLAAGENERAVKMMETVIEQYPSSHARFAAYLALGRYYAGAHEPLKAVGILANLKQLENATGEVEPADRDLYLEGLYLMGTSYFQARNYGAAFPILRRITANYANTVWANQAYYYIGMCHFVQQNWSKAIEALNLVGTFIDVTAGATDLVEAGRRFYVKVSDKDMAVLTKLGKQATVELSTARGDHEKIDCIPLGAEGDVLIGSIATEIGVAHPDDRVLQVLGGDTLTVRYTDANTEDGAANVVREAKAKVVSSGTVAFTLGDSETPASAAFLDQPLSLALFDADLDASDAADTVTVHLVARYKETTDDSDATAGAVDLKKLLEDDPAKQYRTRDEVTVRLTEVGKPPVHTGRFTGKVLVQAAQPEKPANPSDDVLTCAVDDEIVMTYTDELHLGGATPRQVQSVIRVVGEIDNLPRASQDVVSDPVVKSRKNLVEASAFLELARIFKSMGLMKGARQKAADGLERVDYIIRTSSAIPGDLKQQAFKTKWELYMAEDDYDNAIATCSLFNRLFPDSPLVDEALMGIARIRLDNKDYGEAMKVLRRILELPKSQVKAEAQFRIAEATEASLAGRPEAREASVQQYKLCAERYPDSEFAGQSLAKLVDYHVEMRDFAQAGELLEQIFQDHPDASFLDAMLLKWVLVAYSSGDYTKARDKCAQLLFEYPGSSYADKAKQILPKIEAKLKSEPAAAAGEKAP